ncbi:MAG: lipopolysaccharide heptosyltransferase I [Pseudomonadota bacterium]|nr:lipopolysaccharide heptosyltransferase I [Pseudomonadota bacterium]
MLAPHVLFVKLSSLGDVIHHLPAVTDLLEHRPDARVSWAVEEAYADLVRLHPGVCEVIPVGLRGLKANVLDAARWRRVAEARRTLGRGRWDYVIDAQGLIKSALVARAAHGAAFGLDHKSARERMAARFYDVKIAVERGRHAVERNRELVAQVFGYALERPARYGLVPPAAPPPWAPAGPYAVLLHAASRLSKRWPDDHWVKLARMLSDSGYATVFPGGSEAERAAAARLALIVPGALAAPPMGLDAAAGLIAHAALVAGVDTGLTHLAVALGRPTVGIYTATRPELTGLYGSDGVNLGGPGKAPSVEAVAAALGYYESAAPAPIDPA